MGAVYALHSPITSSLCHASAAEVDVKADSKGKEAFRRPLRRSRVTVTLPSSSLASSVPFEWCNGRLLHFALTESRLGMVPMVGSCRVETRGLKVSECCAGVSSSYGHSAGEHSVVHLHIVVLTSCLQSSGRVPLNLITTVFTALHRELVCTSHTLELL
jgi:hypothetical protein